MKKESQFFLIGLTILFIGFLLGMLVGRSIAREPVVIQGVPTEAVLPSSTTTPTESIPSGIGKGGRININTASAPLLDTLPGVGPILAQRIVDYRDKNGPFQDVSELSNVEGIGNGTMLKIVDMITVED